MPFPSITLFSDILGITLISANIVTLLYNPKYQQQFACNIFSMAEVVSENALPFPTPIHKPKIRSIFRDRPFEPLRNVLREIDTNLHPAPLRLPSHHWQDTLNESTVKRWLFNLHQPAQTSSSNTLPPHQA
jgi:hypothetical protein